MLSGFRGNDHYQLAANSPVRVSTPDPKYTIAGPLHLMLVPVVSWILANIYGLLR